MSNMPIHVETYDDVINLIVPWEKVSLEQSVLIENLKHLNLSGTKEIFYIQTTAFLKLSVKISDVMKANITSLTLFENTVLSGFSKQPAASLTPFTYSYIYSFGTKVNHEKLQEEEDKMLKALDKDDCDLMDWTSKETAMYRKYKIRSDDYLDNVFKHTSSTNQLIALAQGHVKHGPGASLFTLFPLEVMMEITNHVAPSHHKSGQPVFASVIKQYNKQEEDTVSPLSLRY